MDHSDTDKKNSDKKLPSLFTFFYRSLTFCLLINIVVAILIMYSHSSHLDVPLITTSPCDLEDDFLNHYNFTTDRVVLHNSETTENSSCTYTRAALALGARVVNDSITVSVYKIPYAMPQKFTQFGPGHYTDNLDRYVSNGHEIRVTCTAIAQCFAYIYPNVIMDFHYLSGDSPRYDALRWARTFVHGNNTRYT